MFNKKLVIGGIIGASMGTLMAKMMCKDKSCKCMGNSIIKKVSEIFE